MMDGRQPFARPDRAAVPGGLGMVGAAGRHRSFCALRFRRPVRAALAGLHDRDFPRYARFGNAFIETSLPSVVILVLSRHMEPTTVFGSGRRCSISSSSCCRPCGSISGCRVDRRCRGRATVPPVSGSSRWRPSTDEPEHALIYHVSRSIVLLLPGDRRHRGRRLYRQFDSRSPRPPRATASPIVRPARLAAGGRPPDGQAPNRQRDARGCRPVPRHQGLYGDDARAPRRRKWWPAGRRLCRADRHLDRNHGIMNKFLGDGFLALFGAPSRIPRPAQGGGRRARDARGGRSLEQGAAAGRCASASASTSARW